MSKDPAYDSLISRLRTRGIVTLSHDNPYIASNLLIAKEISSSKELEGFIQHKGIPNLIEVNKELLKTLKYKFFYPQERIYYSLELTNNMWIINGPTQITEEQNKQIFYLTGGKLFVPKVLSSDELSSIYPSSNKEMTQYPNSNSNNIDNDFFNPNVENNPVIKDTPSVSKEKGNIKNEKMENNVQKSSKPIPPTTSFASNPDLSLDKIINSTSTYTAELNYRGDLIHYVAYQGETLSLISRWYTKEVNNSEKIARINSVQNGDKLEIGDKIIIPAYLLKNKNKLTQDALKQMINIYGGAKNNGNVQKMQNQNDELEYF